MKHIVIDVESLSLLSYPVITQFAAVVLNVATQGAIIDQSKVFTYNIRIEDQIKAGAMIDSDTLGWWLERNHQTFVDCIEDPIAPLLFCSELDQWFDNNISHGEEFLVWASDPLLDFGGIVKLHEACGVKVPWNHRQQRDARTLRGLAESKLNVGGGPRLKVKVRPECEHNALSDALALATEISRNHLTLGIAL
jgi:hypothetical protein